MTDHRPNNGFHNPEFPDRVPSSYRPTGTHRDASMARTHLLAQIADPAAMRRLHDGIRMGLGHRPGLNPIEDEAFRDRWHACQMGWDAGIRRSGAPFWVAADIMHAIDVAADSYPEPTAIKLDNIPSSGMLITELPLFDRLMIDDRLTMNTAGLSLTGLTWSIGDWSGVEWIQVTPIASAEAFHFHLLGMRNYPVSLTFSTAIRTTPPYGLVHHLGDGDEGRLIEDWGHSVFHWVRLLLALDSWCGTLAEIEETEARAPSKKARRRGRRRVAMTRVVKLRKARTLHRPSGHEDDEDGRRTYSHRWIVGGATGGFWRQQAHGPKMSQRRPVWISPYIKGPEDAPLLVKDTVIKVDR